MPDRYYDYNVDPFDSDTPDYIRVQSDYYSSGAFSNRLAPSSPNFPLGTPTRYFLTLPGIIDTSDLSGSRPISLRDVTGGVNLTRVTGSPGVNEYRVSPSTSERRNVVELNASQAGNEIGFDFYMIGSMPSVNQYGQETIKVASSDSYSSGNASFVIQTVDDAGADISALITTLNSNNGGTIFIEEGTYNLTTSIVMKDNVNLLGQGSGTLLVKKANIDMISDDSSLSNVKIEKLKLDGDLSSYTGYGIHLNTSSLNVKIKENIVTDCGTSGIRVESGTLVEGNEVYLNGIGIILTGDKNKIISNTVYDNTDDGIACGLSSAPAKENSIENNIVYGNAVGVSVVGLSAVPTYSQKNSIVGNSIESNSTYGIELAVARYITISANNINVSGTAGIYFNNADYCTVNGNIIINSGVNSINITSAASTNNGFSGNMTSTGAWVGGAPASASDLGTGTNWVSNT